jgi:UDP-2-acetamido-2-deoxy-ribo-hexuluronate aminotransferase
MSIPFIDLQAQRAQIGARLNEAMDRVLEHGAYIMGPEVRQLETSLGEFIGAKHSLTCANGTDALQLPLMAWGIGPGDAVFTPSFTFASTAEVVALVGAEPVMVDVLPDTFNIDPDDLEKAIEKIKTEGKLRARAIIAVDLFGLAADYPRIQEIARAHDLKLIADSAQGFGATLNGQHPASWADATTTSFFPAKPLGCYGDGGAVFTDDDELADIISSIRNHGKGAEKYDNVRIGLNSRLDTLQAAILIEKLEIFSGEIDLRNKVADRYAAGLSGPVTTPVIPTGSRSVWAQYTLVTERRDELGAALKEQNIPTATYYPKPLHQQTAYKHYPQSPSGLPVSSALAKTVISLPMHPYLSESDQDRIIEAVRGFFGN